MKPIEKRDLVRRLCSLLKLLNTNGNGWTLEHPLVQDYLKRMSDPARLHHTLDLVRERTEMCASVRTRIVKDRHVEFALFMLNAVCEPGCAFNAERSSEYAARFLGPKNAEIVASLILATDEAIETEEPIVDMRYFLDIVHSVYARDRVGFERYLRSVAIEMRSRVEVGRFVDDSVNRYRNLFEKAQSRNFFLTPYFDFKYGQQVIENLHFALRSFGQKVA